MRGTSSSGADPVCEGDVRRLRQARPPATSRDLPAAAGPAHHLKSSAVASEHCRADSREAGGELVGSKLGAVARGIGLAAWVGAVLACADASWQAVRARDEERAYNQYLRSNPDSPYAAEARQRLDFLRARGLKSTAAFEAFASKYPQSPWLEDLRAEMEPLYFEKARATNTPEAYRAFLASYPDGALAPRAQGNLVYVEQIRGASSSEAMQMFLEKHPESDFAIEARQALDLVALRAQTQIRSMGVRVEVAPNVAQPQRVERGFAAMVARRYAELGIPVSFIPRSGGPTPDMDAWVRVDYEESQATGVLGGATQVARCRIRVYHETAEEPIWDRTFEAPAEHVLDESRGRDKTIFGNSRYAFWKQFFIPVSTWKTAATHVHRIDYLEDVASIDVSGDRAAVMFARGGFDLIDISTPAHLTTVGRYRREQDLSRWSGVKIVSDDLVLLYGPDGAEFVDHSGPKPKPIGRWELPEIGAIRAAGVYEQTALFAGNRGVYAVRLNQRPLKPHRLLEGDYVGVEVGPVRPGGESAIYLVSPTRVEVTAPQHLLRHMIRSRVALGPSFGASRSRRIGDSLFVFGKNETVELSLVQPIRPELKARIDASVLGAVNDMTGLGGQLYVVGDRGLQVAGAKGEVVVDAIQVGVETTMTRKDHYLFLAGARALEVVDIGPYAMHAAAAPAAPESAAEPSPAP